MLFGVVLGCGFGRGAGFCVGGVFGVAEVTTGAVVDTGVDGTDAGGIACVTTSFAVLVGIAALNVAGVVPAVDASTRRPLNTFFAPAHNAITTIGNPTTKGTTHLGFFRSGCRSCDDGEMVTSCGDVRVLFGAVGAESVARRESSNLCDAPAPFDEGLSGEGNESALTVP